VKIEKQTDQKRFIQKHKNVMCYKCGKKSHYANKCPSGDNDDKALQLDQVPATTAGLFVLDGVASMMVSYYSKREARSHRSVLDKHENSNKENPRNREPGCIHTIILNVLEYD
jgi:hypothetical protein